MQGIEPWYFLILLVPAIYYFFTLRTRATASVYVRVRNGKVEIEKGVIKAFAKELIVDVCREEGVKRGHIAVTEENRVKFSSNFPDDSRQRLRNILSLNN